MCCCLLWFFLGVCFKKIGHLHCVIFFLIFFLLLFMLLIINNNIILEEEEGGLPSSFLHCY